MSTDTVSLTDLESIIKAAEAQSTLMSDPSEILDIISDVRQGLKGDLDNNYVAEIITSSVSNNLLPGSLPGTPNNSSTNIAETLDIMSNDSSKLSQMMEESMQQFNPEMIEEAKRLLQAGQGQHIIDEMQRRGMNVDTMTSQIKQQQNMMKGLSVKNDMTKKCILITANRQLKVRNIPIGMERVSACNLIKSGQAVELSCSRLATGHLIGKTIKVWCDPECRGRNKRLSRILGFPIAGDGLFIMLEGDLTEENFLAVEKQLV